MDSVPNIVEIVLLFAGAAALALGAIYYRAPETPQQRRGGAIAMGVGLPALVIGLLTQVQAVPSSWAFVDGAALVVGICVYCGAHFVGKHDWTNAFVQASSALIVIDGLLQWLHAPGSSTTHVFLASATSVIAACVLIALVRATVRKRSQHR